MLISVIIPVFNASIYIQKAIESVLIQRQVSEIIIIDDGSTDNSLQICKNIAETNQIIKVFQHSDKKNHGRSATRNLGIKNALGTYVAFLDADDFYLPNRFEKDIEILENQPKIDGVYNAISAYFYREANLIEKNKLKLTTIREKIKSENLFEAIGPIGHLGYFSGIGLTVKKDIFDKIGFFNENLVVAEDTELWLRMALKTNLISGIIKKPVAIRGVHEKNVSFNNDDLYNVNNLKMYESLLNWSYQNKIPLKRIGLIWKKIWINRGLNKTNFISDLQFWLNSIFKYPSLLRLKRFYITFPLLKRIKYILF